jgi:four helix bundle protein
MSSQGLQRLQAWSKAKAYTISVYKLAIPCLPSDEKWALTSQIRRSAQSIPANIAEGYGRYYYQDNIRYCYIARGSLEETISHLILARELGYLDDVSYRKLVQQGDELDKVINGYIAYLKRSRQGLNEPGSPQTIKEVNEIYAENDENDVNE